jgi:hypothetical protein
LSIAAPGTSTAATGVANSPFTEISMRAMFAVPQVPKVADATRITAALSSPFRWNGPIVAASRSFHTTPLIVA